MLKPDEILAILDGTIASLKDVANKKDKNKLPNFYPGYAEAVRDAREFSVHLDKDVIPYELFNKTAPNETEEELHYRKENYKAVTVASTQRAVNSTRRIFNPANWNEKYPEIAPEDSPKDYFTKDYPEFGSLAKYFQQVFITKKIADPNAVFVCHPGIIPDKVNPEGEIIPDDTAMLQPIVKIYDSKNVAGFLDNVYALVLLAEKSLVKYGQREVREGLIFELYDDTNIYRFTQIGKKTDLRFEVVLVFEHNLGYVPVQKLKGIIKECDENLNKFYESYFGSAVPKLNAALWDESTLQVVKVKQAYPQRWAYADDCDALGCDQGWVYDRSYGKDGKRACSDCNGTGQKVRFSPFRDMLLRMPNNMENGDSNIGEPAGYIAPSPDIMEFLRNEIETAIVQAWVSLNIDVSNSNVKGSDTALEVKIDREEFFSFLIHFSNEVFDAYEFSVRTLGRMRYGDAWENYEITPPKTFDVRLESELVAEIAEARRSNLSPALIATLENALIDMRFNGSSGASQEIKLAQRVDRLFSLSNQDILGKVSARLVERWEVILHDSISTFIAEAIAENADFMSLEFAIQRDKLVEMAQAKALAITAANSQAQSIIDNANA